MSPPGTGAAGADAPWWAGAVIYQVYPRSFCLADPEGRRRRLADPGALRFAPPPGPRRAGVGDLEGIRRHLDHLVRLGVDAVWLCPFFPSPGDDGGYDVADYCDVDPLLGDLGDLDRLVADAHALGLRVLLDWVPNHTSDRHPWFVESRSSRASPKRGWYLWRQGRAGDPALPPNNWRRAFGDGPAWSYDEATREWYLHLFLPSQPDLDWSNPEVAEAMEAVLDFWLARGVDGFRIDVAHALGKDPALPDLPPERAWLPVAAQHDDERTHAILRRLRAHLDAHPRSPVALGEVFLLDAERVARYYGAGDELHLAFDFVPMFCGFDPRCLGRALAEIDALLAPAGAWPALALSSHDRPRHRTRYGGSERRARLAAVVLLTTRATAVLYAGEELGLEDAVVPEARRLDPGGRDPCRAPIPWTPDPEHGWALEGGETWLPWPPEASVRNVESQWADEGSILHLYRELLALRHHEPAMRLGEVRFLPCADPLLAFVRTGAGRAHAIFCNFGDAPLEVPSDVLAELDSPTLGRIVLSSVGRPAARRGEPFEGVLRPEEAVVTRLAD